MLAFIRHVPLTARPAQRHFVFVHLPPFPSTLLLGGLLVTCGCGQGAQSFGPPPLPLPPPPGCGNTGAGVCYHVATTGNDGNPGTAAQPFLTIQHAADIVNPGDGVLVEDGVYTGGSTVVWINRSGTAANRIVFRAANRWQAVIDGQSNGSTTGIAIPGGFVWVEGFEVRNTSRYGIDTDVGHDQVVIGNHVHDIGRICTDNAGGIVGIDAYASGLVIAGNWIHDVGRFGPGESGCTPGNFNWQNHDHGIYNGIGTNVVIMNNVFYNLAHGWAIQRYDGQGAVVHGLYIMNNTFVGANPNRDAQVIIATETDHLVIANNIFYQPKTAGVWFDRGGNGATLTGNVATGNLQIGGSGLVTSGNLQNTDPQFVNAGTQDFHLTGGSAARNAGVAKWCPPIDYDGGTRSACSAGAFH
jgi:parallel beta helix pectate lyase-like protein